MTSPFKLTQIYKGLTSKNQLLKRKLKLGTSEIPIPPKKSDVTAIEAINRFTKANPRVDTTNLKPLSVKQSNIKQSNVNQPNEGAIQSAFDTATREAQFEGYPAPNYDKFKARYLKKNMKADGGRMGYKNGEGVITIDDKIDEMISFYKDYLNQGGKMDFKTFSKAYIPENFADGGRIGYKDGPKLTDFFDVQASGTKSGKTQIEGAPEGLTSDKETISAILTMDIPLAEKINLIGNLEYGKFRDKIEYKDNEIFLEDPASYRNRNIGLEYNRDGEGFSGSATVGDEGPEFNIRYKKSFADGGMLVQPSDDGSRPGYATSKVKTKKFKYKFTNQHGTFYSDKPKKSNTAPKVATKEFIEQRDKGKDVPKVREYLRKILRKKDNVVFKNIKDIMTKAGLPKTSKVDADVSRLLQGEFKDIVQTEGQLQKTKYGNNAEKFRKILREIQKTIPKGKKQFINAAYIVTKNNLSGDPYSGSYYRVLNEPEFNNFVVLTQDIQSNPQIIRFAEEFEKLYEMQDIGRDFELQLAQNIYGDTKPKTISKIRADASKYAEFLYGVREVTDANGNKLKLPSVEKRGDYLFELIDETIALQEGEKGKVKPIKFGSGIERDRMLAIRDGLLGLKEGETEGLRTNIKKLLKKGYNLDEVAGLAATHELAPGYTELVQGLKAKINADKMTKIDKPFARIFEQVITGQKPVKGFQYGKKLYQDINEVVKLYNKDAAAYGKKYNIDVPLIEYDPRPGKKVNPKNFLPNFKYLSPAAQANVKELADKGIGVRTEAFTMGQLESKNLNVSPKEQIKLFKKMGYLCNKSSGGAEDVACYLDDVKKTRADLKSSDINVRAKAITKQRNALNVAKKLPEIGKVLRRVGQGTLAGVTTTLKALGFTSPIGYAIEGAVEGGIYDYYRAKGYNHEQSLAETFTPGIVTGRPEGVPWYGGAEKLLEKELVGDPQQNPKVLQYQQALKDQEQFYDAFGRKLKYQKLQDTDQGTYKKLAADASADIQDLYRSGTVSNINRIMNPESMASQAYNTAVERQLGLQDERARDYKAKNYAQKEPSEFMQEQKLKDRNKAMLEMFPMYTQEEADNMYKKFKIEKPENFNIDIFNNVMRDQDKTNYFADNFRLEKAGGGIAKMAGDRSGAMTTSMNPDSQGLSYLFNRVKKV